MSDSRFSDGVTFPVLDGGQTSRIRVCHLIGATVAGGAEKVAVDLACHLSQHMEVAVFALSDRSDAVGQSLRRRLNADGIRFGAGPSGSVGIKSVLALRAFIARFKPEIVHLHTPNTELAFALATGLRKGPDAARTIHNTEVTRDWLYRWAFARNRVRESVACGESAASANSDWAGKAVVIRNGVDFSWPVQSPGAREAARRTLSLEMDVRHFVMVGAMRGESTSVGQKAHDIVIDAWRQVSSANRSCQLHLIGDGNLRGPLESLASGIESIRFEGVSDRVSEWLLASDVFLMPSRFEGLPIAAIEALGTGIPCVFSSIKPLMELDPERVVWVEPGDRISLAAALEEAMEDEFKGSVADAHRIRAQFGVEVMGASYMRYYQRLLENKQGTGRTNAKF